MLHAIARIRLASSSVSTCFKVGRLVLLLALSPYGCHKPTSTKSEKPAAPAKVEMVPHESELATVKLTPEAATRLGIESVTAVRKPVAPHRVFGGELVTPPAQSIVVSAPIAGIIAAPNNTGVPIPGRRVDVGDPVLILKPILSPERDVPTPAEQVAMAGAKATLVAAAVTAQGDVDRGKAELANAKIVLDRALKLLADRAGSQRAVDDAQALFNISSRVLAAAEERLSQLTKLSATLESPGPQEATTTLVLRAPVVGLLRSLNVSVGQQVVAGSTLFEVLDDRRLWIRVPIFVDLLSTIRLDQPATLSNFHSTGKDAKFEPIEALPVVAPPTADPASSTIDVYYAIDNPRGEFQPGRRLAVNLKLVGEQEALVIPASSIVYDIHGNTWVYAVVGEHLYRRNRLQIRWVEGNEAIVERSSLEGAAVVTGGVAELFGTEFGAGK